MIKRVNNYLKTILTSLLIASFLGTAAASPAALQMFPQDSSTKVNSFTSYEVELKNTGPTADVYTVSSAQEQVKVAPTRVPQEGVLEPGQTETVNVWYNPVQNQEAGTYSFTVTARSRATGNTFTTEGSVEVIKDHEVSLDVSESRTACLGEKANYEIAVTNEGIQKEEFSLKTRYGKLSRSSISLEPGETATVTLTASSDEPVQETFNVIAASKTSYAQEITSVQFNAERCYASDVSINPGKREVAAYTPAEFDVTVRNTGTRDDTFTLSTSRGELNQTKMEIEAGETEKTSLSYTPQEIGDTELEVTAKSGVTSTASATVTAKNGMKSQVSFTSESYSVCENTRKSLRARVTNSGEAAEEFDLSASSGELSTGKVELEPGESSTVNVTLNSSTMKTGKERTVRLVSTSSTFGEPSSSDTATVTKENCYDIEMSVVPEVASSGENKSVIYRIDVKNPGTKANTYRMSVDGPSWVSVRPSEIEVEAGGSGSSYMYAGIPFEKKGRVDLTAVAEGTQVSATESVRLLIGQEVKEAIESPEQEGPTGGFSMSVPDVSVGSAGFSQVLASLILGLLLTGAILYHEW